MNLFIDSLMMSIKKTKEIYLFLTSRFLTLKKKSRKVEEFLIVNIMNLMKFILLVSVLHQALGKRPLLEGVYLYGKPFYYEKDGVTDGMVWRIFQAARACLKDNVTSIQNNKYNDTIDFNYRVNSKVELIEQIKRDASRNNSHTPRIYLPILSEFNPFNHTYQENKNVETAELFRAEGIAVIMHNSKIYLGSKILRGLSNSSQIFSLVFFMLLFAAALLWIFERNSNDEIDRRFSNGFGKSIWWGVVTLSTVGYGDVVPKTFIGRVIGIIWMSVAVMLTSILTSTLTDNVIGISDLKINDKTVVACLPNSIISHYAKQNYNASVIIKNSTKEILEAVHNEDVGAGLLDTYYAAWHQDDFEENYSVSVVYIIEKPIMFDYAVNLNQNADVKSFFNCTRVYSNEFYEKPISNFKRKCKTRSLKYEDIRTILLEGVIGKVIFGLAVVLLVFFIVYQILIYIFVTRKRKNQDFKKEDSTEQKCSQNCCLVNKNLIDKIMLLKEDVKEISKQIDVLKNNREASF